MKRTVFLSIAAGVAVMAVACGGGGGTKQATTAPPTTAPTTAPTKAAAAPTSAAATTASAGGGDVSTGQTLFGQYCKVCHGDNAAGGYQLGADKSANIRWASLSDTYNETLVARAITDGLDEQGKDLSEVMPRWKDTLSTAQVNSLIAYLKTLTTDAPDNQPPAAPAGTSAGGQLFYQYCALCHGTDGSGGKDIGTSTSADLRWAKLSDGYNNDTTLIARAITQGLDESGKPLDAEMPHWDGTLTADQVQQIIAFLQTLK